MTATFMLDERTSSTLEERRVVLNAIRKHANPDGTVPNSLVRPAADRLKVSTRQVRRWLKANELTVRAHFVPSEKHIDVLYACHGNAAKAWRDCIIAGLIIDPKDDPKKGLGERQFRRGFDLYVDQAIVQGARKGWSGFVVRRGYGTKYAPYKGHTYATDSTPMNVWVSDDRKTAYQPWETNLIDEASRLALVVATSDSQPNTETVIAVLAAGIGGTTAPDGTPLGGMPEHVLSDNGGEYKNLAVTAGLVRVGFKMTVDGTELEGEGHTIKRKFTHRASGFQNGRDERFHQTMHVEFCSSLPGYVDPKLSTFERLNRIQYWKDHPELLLTKDQLDVLLIPWVNKYNFERVHTGLTGEFKGMTPFEAWKADDRELPLPDAETMRLSMLAGKTRIVDKGRVHIFSKWYHAVDLGEHDGHTVEVRYLPGRTETVEIFYLGQYIGTATREDLLGDNYHSQVVSKRDKQTTVHLAHALGGEKFKTERARKELLAAGFTETDLPAVPESTWADTQVPKRREDTHKPAATEAERQYFASIVDKETPTYDEEEIA